MHVPTPSLAPAARTAAIAQSLTQCECADLFASFVRSRRRSMSIRCSPPRPHADSAPVATADASRDDKDEEKAAEQAEEDAVDMSDPMIVGESESNDNEAAVASSGTVHACTAAPAPAHGDSVACATGPSPLAPDSTGASVSVRHQGTCPQCVAELTIGDPYAFRSAMETFPTFGYGRIDSPLRIGPWGVDTCEPFTHPVG